MTFPVESPNARVTLVRMISTGSASQQWEVGFATGFFFKENERKFLVTNRHVIRDRFNSSASYKGRVLKWDTIIEQKVAELGRLLTDRASTIDFAEPEPSLVRDDNHIVRTRILSLSQSEAEELGIGKSTLRYLRKNAQGQTSFKLYGPVARRLKATRMERRCC